MYRVLSLQRPGLRPPTAPLPSLARPGPPTLALHALNSENRGGHWRRRHAPQIAGSHGLHYASVRYTVYPSLHATSCRRRRDPESAEARRRISLFYTRLGSNSHSEPLRESCMPLLDRLQQPHLSFSSRAQVGGCAGSQQSAVRPSGAAVLTPRRHSECSHTMSVATPEYSNLVSKRRLGGDGELSLAQQVLELVVYCVTRLERVVSIAV